MALSFNFNGMMQGFGKGMASMGTLMEEQNKRDWQEKMEQAKYDREEHLAKLKIDADRANNTAQLEQRKFEFNNESAAQKSAREDAMTRFTTQSADSKAQTALQQQQINKNYELQSQANAIQRQIANKPSAGAELFKLQQDQINKKSAEMEAAGIPEGVINFYKWTGTLPTGGDGKKNFEIGNKAYEDAGTDWEKMSNKEKKDSGAVSKLDYQNRAARAAILNTSFDSSPLGVLTGMKDSKQSSTQQPTTPVQPMSFKDSESALLDAVQNNRQASTNSLIQKIVNDKGIDAAQMAVQNVEKSTGKILKVDWKSLNPDYTTKDATGSGFWGATP